MWFCLRYSVDKSRRGERSFGFVVTTTYQKKLMNECLVTHGSCPNQLYDHNGPPSNAFLPTFYVKQLEVAFSFQTWTKSKLNKVRTGLLSMDKPIFSTDKKTTQIPQCPLLPSSVSQLLLHFSSPGALLPLLAKTHLQSLFNAMISGLFQLGSSYEWVVTKKLGRSSEADLIAYAEKESDPLVVETTSLHRSSSESGLGELNKIETLKKTGIKRRNRLYRKELALALILLTASLRSLLSAQGIHFYFLLFQGFSFLGVGLDLIGEQVS